MVTLKVFGGLTIPEIAAEVKVAERTVKNDWALAREKPRRTSSTASPGAAVNRPKHPPTWPIEALEPRRPAVSQSKLRPESTWKLARPISHVD